MYEIEVRTYYTKVNGRRKSMGSILKSPTNSEAVVISVHA